MDIRQSPFFVDDFNRTDEEPLSHGGDWARTDAVWSQGLRLKYNIPFSNGTAVEPSAGSKFGSSYWIPMSMDNDDAEFWGMAVGGNYPGIHWQIGIESSPGGSSAVDGYAFRRTVTTAGGSLRLIKVVNGSYATNLDVVTSGSGVPTSGQHMLIRRNGNDVEGWMSGDFGANWTLWVSATDTTYLTGFHGTIALSDNSRSFAHGWDDVGGGPPPVRHLQDTYRIIGV